MGLTVLTAITIGTNYPENIKVETGTDNGVNHAGFIYITRDGHIHNLLVSTPAVFISAEEAETTMKDICEGFKKTYGTVEE